jgi:hypothetical protein
MKMVKSAFLVSAASLVAVAGAQAADLPVKAKPVEYVKVCSLYGAGFYYIPGTDICMKVGGYVRYQINTGEGNNNSFGPFNTTGGTNNRLTTVDVNQRVRALMTMDTRQQTAYGTLRTYLIMGYTHDTAAVPQSPAPSLYFNRGFIQIAGFTLGKATSFFDFASTAAVAYNAGYLQTTDTGDPGQVVGAYTAQFGNGLSATLGIEESRRAATVDTEAGLVFQTLTNGKPIFAIKHPSYTISGPTYDVLGGSLANGTSSLPDIVGNIRIDQAWGSAQIAGALHDVSAAYYSDTVTPGQNEINGHPDNKWGWAVLGGLRLNAPMIGPGDYFQAQAVYSEGAIRYAAFNGGGNNVSDRFNGNSFGFGFYEDATFLDSGATTNPNGAPTSFNLTTAWSVFASYEHFWTPNLRTSIYGSYASITHNDDAKLQICNGFGVPTDVQCNPDFQIWSIGSRSQWNVTKDFYVGVDVIYSKLNTATVNNGNPVFLAGAGPDINTTLLPGSKPAGFYRTEDQDAWSFTWRAHRDIVP